MPEKCFYEVLAFDFLLPYEVFLNCDMEFLERYGVQVKVSGSGGVVKQSIITGEAVIRGSVIKLELA